MSPAPISAEKHAERKALYDKGLSDKQIAEELNLTRAAIISWRGINNLPSIFKRGEARAITLDDEMARRNLHSLGFSDIAIAIRIGVQRTTIRGWRIRRGLPVNPSKSINIPLTDEEKNKIADLNERGFNDREIAERIGRHSSTIGIFRRNSGLPAHGRHKWEPYGRKQETIDRDTKVINFYYQHRDLTWKQIGDAVGVKPSKVRLIVGEHLMRVCRAEEECPYKALLPEYEEEKEVRARG